MEDSFKEGWSRLTKAIRDTRGGLGSRLHSTPDGIWVAYAQWPDRATWERSQQSEISADPEAMELMTGALEERFTPLLLEPQTDLLQRCPAEPAG